MDEKGIKHLLTALGIATNKAQYTGSKKKTQWLTVSCPFAPWTHSHAADAHPSFGITINEQGQSHYKCLACQMKGRLQNLPVRLGGYREENYSKLTRWAITREMELKSSLPLPTWDDEPDFEMENVETHGTKAEGNYPLALGIPFVRQRGVTVGGVIRTGLRFDEEEQRVLFPVHYPDGAFAGYSGRSIRNRKTWPRTYPKTKDYHGLDKRSVFLSTPRKFDGKKIIVEGTFDYAALVSNGYNNSRAILGTAITPEKLNILLQEGDPVYLFMDNDKAGWQAAFGIPNEDGELNKSQSWAHSLYREVPVWIVPYPSAELDGTDPGSLADRKTLHKLISKAWLYTGEAPYDSLGDMTFSNPANVADF